MRMEKLILGVPLLLALAGCSGLVEKAKEMAAGTSEAPPSSAETTSTPPPPPPPAAAAPPSAPAPVAVSSNAVATQEPAARFREAPVGFDVASFNCCSNERVQLVVQEYLDLQTALAKNNSRVSGECYALEGAAQSAVKHGGMSSDSRRLAQEIVDLVVPVRDANIDTVRQAFDDISDKVIALARANEGGSKKVAVAFCSQSNANWLQASETIENPYGVTGKRTGVFRQ